MSIVGSYGVEKAANASIEKSDRRQRKNPFVHSPKNFHIGEGPSPDSGDHTGSIRETKTRIRINTMKAKKKAAAKKAPAKKPAAKKKAKK
jgi:hypothetical protein